MNNSLFTLLWHKGYLVFTYLLKKGFNFFELLYMLIYNLIYSKIIIANILNYIILLVLNKKKIN